MPCQTLGFQLPLSGPMSLSTLLARIINILSLHHISYSACPTKPRVPDPCGSPSNLSILASTRRLFEDPAWTKPSWPEEQASLSPLVKGLVLLVLFFSSEGSLIIYSCTTSSSHTRQDNRNNEAGPRHSWTGLGVSAHSFSTSGSRAVDIEQGDRRPARPKTRQRGQSSFTNLPTTGWIDIDEERDRLVGLCWR